MTDKKWRVKFCYTVKGEKYAIALANTLKLCNFPKDWAIVFAYDNETKKVLDKYDITYRDSYGLNVYHDKILNAMTISIERPDQVIVAIDIPRIFDKDDFINYFTFNKDLFLKGGKNIYIFTYGWYGDYRNIQTGNSTYINQINCGINFFVNINENIMKTYLNYYHKCDNNAFYINRKYASEYMRINRYVDECNITEETLLQYILHTKNSFKKCISVDFDNIKPFDRLQINRWMLRNVLTNNWGNTFEELVKNDKQGDCQYFFLEPYWTDIKKYFERQEQIIGEDLP